MMIRHFLLGVALVGFSASFAHADTNVLAAKKVGSIISFSCTSCEKEDEEDPTPQIEVGHQKLDALEVDGEKKLYRTENWLGGSPVSYIHIPITPEEEVLAGLNNGDEPAIAVDGHSVASIGGGDRHLSLPVMADIAGQDIKVKDDELDSSSFELRLK